MTHGCNFETNIFLLYNVDSSHQEGGRLGRGLWRTTTRGMHSHEELSLRNRTSYAGLIHSFHSSVQKKKCRRVDYYPMFSSLCFGFISASVLPQLLRGTLIITATKKIITHYGDAKGPVAPPTAPSGNRLGRNPSPSHHTEWFLQ